MSRLLFRLFALCLALSWVPVTAHCRMEVLGVEMADCAEECHDQAPAHAADLCGLVENGLYKATVEVIKVMPAAAIPCLLLVFRPTLAGPCDPGPTPDAVGAGRPRDWVPTWHFVQRAAPSPRAPSVIFA